MPFDLFRFSWHAVPYFPAALLIAGVGTWIYARERGNRVSGDFLAFTLLLATWVFGKGLRVLLVDAEAATVLSRFLRATLSLGVAPLMSFAFTVLHTWPERRRALRAHCVIGIGMAITAVGTPWIIAGVWEAPWGFTP